MLRNLYRKIVEKLLKQYRVEIIDDITLSQSRQFALKPITVILLSMLLLFSIIIGTASMIVFTPSIRKHIPGYLDPIYTEEQNKLLDQLVMLERRVSEQDTIIKSLSQLAGTEGVEAQQKMSQYLDTAQRRVSPVVGSLTSSTNTEFRNTGFPPAYTSVLPATNRSSLIYILSPLEGEVRQGFNPDIGHYGVDIVADENELIRSAADGFVIISDYSDESGLFLVIRSEGDIITTYKHNSRLLKKVGEYVYAGEPIAVIGNSGENSSGFHLHFELWHQGNALDPDDYIHF